MSLAKNSAYNFFFRLVTAVSTLGTSVAVGRILGPETAGIYSLLFWAISVAVMMSTLGLPSGLTKHVSEYAQREDQITIRQIVSRSLLLALGLSAIASLIFYLLIFAGVIYLNVPQLVAALAIAAIPGVAVTNLMTGVLQGLGRFRTLLHINLFAGPANFVLTLAVLMKGYGLTGLIVLNLFYTLAVSLATGYALRDRLEWKTSRPEPSLILRFRHYALAMSGIVLLDMIVWQKSEILFLSIYSGAKEIAYYSIAYTLISRLMVLLPGSVSGVLLPYISAFHGEGAMAKIEATYYKTTRYLALMTLPIIASGIALANPLIESLYGPTYRPMAPVLSLLLFSGGLAALVAPAPAVVYGTNRQDFNLKLSSVVAVLNLALDLAIIPKYGAIGAAMANGTAQLIGIPFGLRYLSRHFKLAFPWRDTFKIGLAAGLAGLLVHWIVAGSYLGGLAALAAGGSLFALLYLIAILLFRVINEDDRAVLAHMINIGAPPS